MSDTPAFKFMEDSVWWYRDYAFQLERENAALRELAAGRAAFIEHHRITTPAHTVVAYTQDDKRIWEERVQRHAALDRAFIDAARAKKGGAS